VHGQVDSLRLSRLDVPTSAPGWLAASSRPSVPCSLSVPVAIAPAAQAGEAVATPLPPAAFEVYVKATQAVARAVAASRDTLNRLDSISGDGVSHRALRCLGNRSSLWKSTPYCKAALHPHCLVTCRTVG
jgi:hypothetical protein